MKIMPDIPHMVAGTGAPVDASTADVVVNVTIPTAAESTAVGVTVLANASAGSTPTLQLISTALAPIIVLTAVVCTCVCVCVCVCVCGLQSLCSSEPFGGILTVVNFTKPAGDGSIKATASIRTLNPCGSGSSGLATATFPILK